MGLELMKKKKRMHLLWYIVFSVVYIVFILTILVLIFSNNKQYRAKSEELNSIRSELRLQELKNSEVEIKSKYLDDEEFRELFISEEARKLDYVKQGERVFIITAGN